MTTRRNILKGGAGIAAILASGKAPAAFVKSMLAARNSIFTKSSGANVPTAKDYVQDGIVNLIDGIENGGFGVHNEGASTAHPFVDCITGAQYSAANTYLTDIGFAQKTVYGFPAIKSEIYGESEFTVEYAALLFGNGSNLASFVRGSDSTKVFYPQLLMANGTTEGGAVVRAGAYGYNASSGIGESRLFCSAFFRMSSTQNNFGVSVNGGSFVIRSISSSSAIFAMPSQAIGYADYSPTDADTGLLQSRLYAIRTYNRWLTDDEIDHNYQIDIKRFSLPAAS